MATIKKNILPKVPLYTTLSQDYFNKSNPTESFNITAGNIHAVKVSLKKNVTAPRDKAINLFETLAKQKNVAMTIKRSDNIYRLILESIKSDNILQINVFSIGNSGIISLLDSQFFNSGAIISVTISDSKDSSKTRQLTLNHRDFNIFINQYVESGSLPTSPQFANNSNQPSSKPKTTNQTPKHLFAGYILTNAEFVQRINKDVLNNFFSPQDIETLVLHSKDVDFNNIYGKISNTIKNTLTLNKEFDESQLESETKKVFLHLIIKRKVSTIKKHSTQNQTKEDLEAIQSLIAESLAEYQRSIAEYKDKVPQLRKRRKTAEVGSLIAERDFLLNQIYRRLNSPQDQEPPSTLRNALTEQPGEGHDSK